MNRIILILFLSAGIFSCKTQPEKTTLNIPQPAPTPTFTSFCAPKNIVLDTEPGFDGTLTPLFNGIEVVDYQITTASKKAQRYFNQGMILAYGFNHAEAARSFKEGTVQDPTCAMCYWGMAWVMGPNYNAGMSSEILPRAQEAIANAKLNMGNATEKEQDLILALAKRYPKSMEEDPKPYYESFAEEMRILQKKYPQDLTIAALAAEALMDLYPWDLWKEDGTPQPWTEEIVDLVENILDKDPSHPQGIHLYIHALEASPFPEKSLPFANRLRNLVPGSGHLTHMPSHIYINTGHYHEGTLANERAVKVDSQYVEACHASGIYPLAYYPHNWHFLAACAALEGKGNRALEASRYMANYVVDKELMFLPEMATLQHYFSIPWYIMVKFAMWEEILMEKEPHKDLIYPRVIWHYARGMAFAGKGEIAAAENELGKIEELSEKEILKSLTIWDINNIIDLVSLAKTVLQAEIQFKKGKLAQSKASYAEAIRLEDQLNYNEPPDWFFSIRHHLGHVLLANKDYKEAQDIYEADLKKYKENGWALMGLHRALLRQGKKDAAAEAKSRYEKAWKWADTPLESSVLN